MPRIVLSDRRANPPKLTASEGARLDAMTTESIDRNAEDDLDNPAMTDEELERAVFARDVRRTREAAGMTQSAFADRFHIALSRLVDWEFGRGEPDTVATAYLKAIRYDPQAIERALEAQD